MTILSDRWIRRMAEDKAMIEPFVDAQKRQGVISYGLSSYGYDARVGRDFKIFTNVDSAVVDPKNFADNSFVDRTADVCIIPPNSFALARTVEYFRIPRDVLVICVGKSTYARCGIIVNVTPLEPEMRISPLSCWPPLMRSRSMVVLLPSDLGQGDAALALILAGLVAVGGLAGLVALQEQELGGAFIGVDLGR